MEEPPGGKVLLLFIFFPPNPTKQPGNSTQAEKGSFPSTGDTAGPFPGTFSTTSAAQLFTASLQKRTHHLLFAFWAGGHHLFHRNWPPSKVPALHSTFLQKAALESLKPAQLMMSIYTRLFQLSFPSRSQPTTPTFIFWSVPTKRSLHRKTRSKRTKAMMTVRQTHFLPWTT